MRTNTQPHFIIKPVDEVGEIVGIAELSGYERDSRPLHQDDFQDCLKSDLTFCVVAKTNRHFDYKRYCNLNSVKHSKRRSGSTGTSGRYIIKDYFSPDIVVGYIVCKARKKTSSSLYRREQEYVTVLSFVVHPLFRRYGIAGDMFECLLSMIPPDLPIHVSVPVDCLEACLLLRSMDFPPPQEVVTAEVPYYFFTYNRKLVES